MREVLGFGKGENVEGKLVTVVHGSDLVNISFLNFQAMQEDTAKVTPEAPPSHDAPLTPPPHPACYPRRTTISPFMMLS